MIKLLFATQDALAVLTIRCNEVRCDLRLTGQDIACVAVDPFRPRCVYCGTFGAGLWRSDDAAEHWRRVGRGILHTKVQSVTVNPSERENGGGVIYAGTEPSAIFRSGDAGESWRECGDLTKLPSSSQWSFPPRPETHHVRWIEPDPHVPGRLFAAIEAGALIRSPDSGTNWQDRTVAGPRDTHQLLVHRSVPGRIYSAAGDGYFESSDGGESWQRFEEGLWHRYLWSMAVDAANPDNIIVFAAASARHSHSDPAESYLYGRVPGSPWRELRLGLPKPAGRRTAILAAHPSEPGTFFAASEREVFRSVDSGASWCSLDVPWPEDCRVNELCALRVAETEQISE